MPFVTMSCGRRSSELSLISNTSSTSSHEVNDLDHSSSSRRSTSLGTCSCLPFARQQHKGYHGFGQAIRRMVHHGAEEKRTCEICYLGVGSSKTVSNICDFDKVPMDFSECRGRVITDPEEAQAVEEQEALRLRQLLRHPPTDSRVPNTNLYMIEPWFHYEMSREEADLMFKQQKYKSGTFLVRTSRRLGRFVLCLADGSCLLHYPIMSVNVGDQCYLTLDNGVTKFKDLVQLVQFYQVNTGHVLPVCLNGYITRVIMIPRFENEAGRMVSNSL